VNRAAKSVVIVAPSFPGVPLPPSLPGVPLPPSEPGVPASGHAPQLPLSQQVPGEQLASMAHEAGGGGSVAQGASSAKRLAPTVRLLSE
jgi:hypothetical protein